MGPVGKMCGKPYVLAFGIVYRLGVEDIQVNLKVPRAQKLTPILP